MPNIISSSLGTAGNAGVGVIKGTGNAVLGTGRFVGRSIARFGYISMGEFARYTEASSHTVTLICGALTGLSGVATLATEGDKTAPLAITTLLGGATLLFGLATLTSNKVKIFAHNKLNPDIQRLNAAVSAANC